MSCKGCSRSIVVSDAYIQTQIEEQLQLEIDLVDDSTYSKRIEICSACPSLLFSNTCGHCGCFVQFRAKLSYKKCPYPEGSKW